MLRLNIEFMDTIFLSDDFKGVKSFCARVGFAFSKWQVDNYYFDVEVAVENGVYVDLRIFDPYQNVFHGYVNPDGWSNWLLDNVDEDCE